MSCFVKIQVLGLGTRQWQCRTSSTCFLLVKRALELQRFQIRGKGRFTTSNRSCACHDSPSARSWLGSCTGLSCCGGPPGCGLRPAAAVQQAWSLLAQVPDRRPAIVKQPHYEDCFDIRIPNALLKASKQSWAADMPVMTQKQEQVQVPLLCWLHAGS